MDRIHLAHSDLAVSRFCLGCMPFGTCVQGRAVDALAGRFRDAGGNFFDTAHCYSYWEPGGDGSSERALGDYVKRNNCRDEVVIATKGGIPATPNYRQVEAYLSPGRIAADIDDSLARLQVDVIDFYWLHRDDPRLEVGAILDMMNAEVARGRIRWFGGSNWTSARLATANRYAAKHDMRGFIASQPKWSLLSYAPVTEEQRLKPGVMLSANEEDRRWHRQSLLPVIPYGPTGNGFFATRGEQPDGFRSPENLARAERASKLADKLGGSPNQMALAWLLHQPFPVIPILGTSNLGHLDDALNAAGLKLLPEQMAWLECG
jgi:aryl-alcohol dehydrogenase-like predicted oxidoreductase